MCVILYFLLLGGAFAGGTTVTSDFVITNRKIESHTFSSTDPTATFTDTGNGLFQIHDNFTDANINIMLYGNQQMGLVRDNSLFKIRMTGQRLGHSFMVSGKYANSSFRINRANKGSYFSEYKNSGCSVMSSDMDNDIFTINSSSNVDADCKGRTNDVGYPYPQDGVLTASGISRDVYLDIGRLQNDKAYRDAPPDVYTGQGTFSNEWLKNRVGNGYRIFYTNQITITKNPYFEGVTLPAGDNVFDVRTTGSEIRGNLVIPYVINGYFTPYNKITLNVTSLNGFKLKDTSSPDKKEIPYSLSTNTGSQRGYPVAINGVSQGAVIISNLPGESYALQGRFNADFSVDKSSAQTGDYSDTLTAVFQISL
ncbi:fimbrial protein [Salmonella enterica subsp. enterica serovar Newport]|nr:fimbrial protein [Salmonella enterica subsp. enterica serovar Newport]EJW0496303.1 fimbrial protein [Salmonella enterica subsp. enterica serovar Newport]ELA5318035.1 fimbrial protein [Salmonella enterica subsp. enterica serovar Newport]